MQQQGLSTEKMVPVLMDTLLRGHFFVNLFLEWSALRYIFPHAYMPISQWRFGPIAKQYISLFLTLNLTFKLFTHSFMPPACQIMLPQTLIQPWVLQRFKLPINFFSSLFLVQQSLSQALRAHGSVHSGGSQEWAVAKKFPFTIALHPSEVSALQ